MVLNGVDEGLRLDPGVVLGPRAGFLRRVPFRNVARMQVGLARALRRFRQELGHQPAGAPGTAAAAELLGDGEADACRDLLGLTEILVRRLLQPLPFESDDALVAARLGALVDGHGEDALAEQLGRARAGRQGGDALPVEAREGTQPVGGVEVDDQHLDRAVRARLQLEAALELQGGAEQHGEGGRLADHARHGVRVVVPVQDRVERGAEPHDAAADVQSLDREGQDEIVHPFEADGRHASGAPMHQARMPFCACRRFSASSNTTERGPSMTSSVTSSPRWAGRQCMKTASWPAAAISLALT